MNFWEPYPSHPGLGIPTMPWTHTWDHADATDVMKNDQTDGTLVFSGAAKGAELLPKRPVALADGSGVNQWSSLEKVECEVLKDQFEHVQLDVAFATRLFGPKNATQLGDGGLWSKGFF